MKQLCTILILLYAGLTFAQNEYTGCGTETKNLELSAKHPANTIITEQLEIFTSDFVTKHHNESGSQRSTPLYIVPVVFHVIHDGRAELISDSIVKVEVTHMNEYMSASNPELPNVVPAFDTLIGDAQIEFRLAQKDPQGMCTNGIDRIYTQATYIGNDYTKINPWPNDKYLNIWVTKGIDGDVTFYGTLAYALYPNAVVGNPNIDGIISKYFLLGANDPFSRPILSHETGHWLNLLPVNSLTCGDTINDHVADTPPMLYSANCNLTQSICNPPVIENVQNIMGAGSCCFMFTKGQVNRMWATLNSTVAGRNNVPSSSNLIATGTDIANPVSCASPLADFTASARYTCTGQSISFRDASYNANVASRVWTFPADATVSSHTTNTTSATFNTGGWKQVSLQVTNTNGTNQKTKNIVYVSDGTQLSAPFFEGFENSSTAQSQWQSINYDNNGTSFQYYTNGGHQSAASYKLNSIDTHYEGDVDELLSPSFNLSSLDSTIATLSFDYSFATADASHINDSVSKLQIFATNDCGATWTRIYTQSGLGLFNAGIQVSPYSPGQGDQYWQNVSMSIPTSFLTARVNFKIQMSSGTGINNFYLDNINIGQSTAGIADMKLNIGSFDIIPNPAQSNATLLVSANSSAQASITMYDAEGRAIALLYDGVLKTGTMQIPFATDQLSRGVYIIRLSNGVSSLQKRFVKI